MPDDIARAEERCMERLKSKIQVLETSYDFDTARLEEKCERLQKQLEIAKESISSALNFLACPDRISETECNEQLAFDELRKALEDLNK